MKTTLKILFLFLFITLVQFSKAQIMNGDQRINGKLGIGPSAPLTFLDCNDKSENVLKSILARLPEGGNGTYIGVKSYWTQALPAEVSHQSLVKSFAIEHMFRDNLNSSINFYRGAAQYGGYMTIGVSQGNEDFVFKRNLFEVNGTIRAKEVKIEATGWADFVFDRDYKLRNLTEVENHIAEHKHLPDMPSEADVKENGIDVAEMQAKLLQKIEELTLYVIDQDKRIKKQDEKIKKQDETITELKRQLGKDR